jgi:hypothetical protein
MFPSIRVPAADSSAEKTTRPCLAGFSADSITNTAGKGSRRERPDAQKAPPADFFSSRMADDGSPGAAPGEPSSHIRRTLHGSVRLCSTRKPRPRISHFINAMKQVADLGEAAVRERPAWSATRHQAADHGGSDEA